MRSRRRTVVLELRDAIERLIDRAGRRPGWRLPSEPALAERFAVSRGTVREALKLLEQEGVIEVVHGSGRYVSALGSLAVDRPVTVFESVTDLLRRHGYEPRTQVLSVERAPARDGERAALGLGHGAEVIRMARVRLDGSEPLVRSVDVFPATLAGGEPAFERTFSGSLCEWLARRGRRPRSSVAEIRAAEPPWLLITERCIDRDGAAVLLSHNHRRSDLLPVGVVRRGAG